MSVVRFLTGALREEAYLPHSLITRNYTWNSVHCKQKSECSSPLDFDIRQIHVRFVARSGTGLVFSYSSSVFLCLYHSNSASYHTSFRSYRLGRIFATDSVVKRNITLFLSHTHTHTHARARERTFILPFPILQFIVRIAFASPVSACAGCIRVWSSCIFLHSADH